MQEINNCCIQQIAKDLENRFWDFYNDEIIDTLEYSVESLNINTKKILNFLVLKDVEGKSTVKHILIINNHQMFNFIDAKSPTVTHDIFGVVKKQIKEMKDNPGIYNLDVKPIHKIVFVAAKRLDLPKLFSYNL